MIVGIIGLVFLFIIRIRFPRGKSIADKSETDMVKLSLKKYEGLKSTISNCGNAT